MKNHGHSCSWRSRHQSKGTKQNHQIPGLEITGVEVVGCQSYDYAYCSWCFGNSL